MDRDDLLWLDQLAYGGLLETVGNSWRGLDPLTVRGVAFWYPFKETADAERLAEGLRKAGVPD